MTRLTTPRGHNSASSRFFRTYAPLPHFPTDPGSVTKMTDEFVPLMSQFLVFGNDIVMVV